MKTAYELAMERLGKTSPDRKVSPEDKRQLADLESQCAARIAQRELLIEGEIAQAINRGDDEALEQLRKQLASNRKTIRAEFEEKKEKVRQVKKG